MPPAAYPYTCDLPHRLRTLRAYHPAVDSPAMDLVCRCMPFTCLHAHSMLTWLTTALYPLSILQWATLVNLMPPTLPTMKSMPHLCAATLPQKGGWEHCLWKGVSVLGVPYTVRTCGQPHLPPHPPRSHTHPTPPPPPSPGQLPLPDMPFRACCLDMSWTLLCCHVAGTPAFHWART